MGDSPLSTTANITGILTFVAAILASVYVRYTTLRNGKSEMDTILQSVGDNLTDIQQKTGFMIQPDDDGDTIWLKKLMTSLYAAELVIAAHCVRFKGTSFAAAMHIPTDVELVGTTSWEWRDAMREVREAQNRQTPLEERETLENPYMGTGWAMTPGRDYQPGRWTTVIVKKRGFRSVWDATRVILNLGRTPRMVYWFRVRGKVLEKIRQRDAIRSRILFHQMSVASSATQRHDRMMLDLLEDRARLQCEVTEIRHIALETNETLKRQWATMIGLELRIRDREKDGKRTSSSSSAI